MKSIRHSSLKFMAPKIEVTEGANDMVGVKSTGKIDSDSSYKISSGGSVLMDPKSVANSKSITPKIRSRNKNALNSLVRIVF